MRTTVRKIRASLIDYASGRKPASPASRYLLYAIGEILLVAIGILLAIQVNNWNENKSKRNEERRILADLKKEVNFAIASKIALRDKFQSQIDTLAMALDKLYSKEVIVISESECSIIASTQKLLWEPSSLATIEELIASGKISLITSEELRKRIILFQSNTSRIELKINRIISQVHLLMDLYPELVIRTWDGIWGVYKCDIIAMKKNPHFLAHLQSNRGRAGGLVRAANDTIALLEDINEHIIE